MATFTGNVLAEGQLPSSMGTLYTVPALTVAFVKAINVLNTDTGQQTVVIALKPTSTERDWKQAILETRELAEFLSDGETIELPAGALIRGKSTGATVSNYVICGVEQS